VSGYRFGPGVYEDLLGIWEYIAGDDLEAADEFFDTLFAQFEHLAAFPRSGHARPDLAHTRPLLFWPVRKYLIIYRIHRDVVEVIAVTHAARDIPTFLRHRESH